MVQLDVMYVMQMQNNLSIPTMLCYEFKTRQILYNLFWF